MKKVFVLLVTIAAIGFSQDALSNDSVVKMVKAGLSADIIVSMIATQPGQYTLSPDQLIALKTAGVPDQVVSAMLQKGSKTGPSAAGASGAVPVAGATGGDPNDPLASHDSGIYLYSKDRNGVYKLTVLEQAAYQGSKTGGILASAMTYGIKKAKIKAVIPGDHASIRVSDALPTFYFYFEDKAAGLGKGGFGASVSNPNQFALLKFEVTKTSRETSIGEVGAFSQSTGTDQKAMITFKSERLRSGLYKVTPGSALLPGEYCFLASQVNMGAMGAGAAGAAQVFDFAIIPAE